MKEVPEPMTSSESGFTLLEVLVSMFILLVVAAGVLPLGLIASSTSENQGHLMARTSEYAQDKMEQLLVLSYGDVISDTRVFPAGAVGGSGLAVGGSVNPAAPVALYVDYLDQGGNLVPTVGTVPQGPWFYQRVWQVTQPQANLKLITVTATVQAASHGGIGRIPIATVAAMKTNPF